MLARGDLVGVPVGERPALAQSLNGVELLLRSRQVAGFERGTECLLVGAARLEVLLQLVVNRSRRY